MKNLRHSIRKTLEDPPNAERDATQAVIDMLAYAWEEGREAGLRDYDDRMPDHSPNPYKGV